MSDIDSLHVWYENLLVGYIKRNFLGLMSFIYDPDWVKSGFAISCTLPLQQKTFSAESGIAHSFFANLLPEAGARDLLVRNLKITNTDFNLLRAIGGECAGALSVLKPQDIPSLDNNYFSLSETDLKTLLRRKGQTIQWETHERPRLSLAGAQNKCPILVKGNKYYIPKKEAPSSHILKFEITDYRHLPAYETFTTMLAKYVGLPVVDIALKQHEGIYFAEIERYDRILGENITRLHQEDFCQALGFSYHKKYQEEGGPSFIDCYHLVRQHSSQPISDLSHLLHWFIFNILAGNSDAHAKNLSFLYSKNGILLAPFYDLICTRAIEKIDYHLAMSVGDERNPSVITEKDWKLLAEQCGIPENQILKQVQNLGKALIQALPICLQDFQEKYGEYSALTRIEQVVRKQCLRAISQ